SSGSPASGDTRRNPACPRTHGGCPLRMAAAPCGGAYRPTRMPQGSGSHGPAELWEVKSLATTLARRSAKRSNTEPYLGVLRASSFMERDYTTAGTIKRLVESTANNVDWSK